MINASRASTQALLDELGRQLGGVGGAVDAQTPPSAVLDPSQPHGGPLGDLESIARSRGLACWLRRMRVVDAVWLASTETPIVGWDAQRERWLLIRRHGLLRSRVWTSDAPDDDALPVSRSELASWLGASSPNDEVDLAILHLERPAEGVAGTAHPEEHAGHGGHVGHPQISPIRRLLALMRPEGPELWSIVVFSAITGLLYLALPLAISAFVSNLSFGAQSGPFLQGLIALAVVLLACLAVAALLRGLQYVVAEVIQRRIFVRLAADLSRRLPRVDLTSLDGVHAPELVNRFLDVVTVQKSTSMILLNGINLVLSAAIGLTVLAFYHPFLLAFSIFVVLAVAGIVLVLGRGAVRTGVHESRCKYEVVGWMEELARHPRTFMVGAGLPFAHARADGLMRDYLGARREHFRVLIRQIGALLALEAIASTLLLVLGGWLVLNQQLTLGQLVASEIIVSAIVASISKLGKQFEAWYDAVAAVDKLGYLVDLPIERRGGQVAPAGTSGSAIVARGLVCSRPASRGAMDPVDLTVVPGERVALLGSRGTESGVVLECMLGLRQQQSGDLSIDGLDVRSWDLSVLRARALLVRPGEIMTGSIADNLALGDSAIDDRRMLQALDEVGLLSVVRSLPLGLRTPVVTGGFPLSESESDRLLAARAIVQRPSLLLIDGLLDGHEGTREILAAALLADHRPWTAVIATTDPRVAARAQRTIDVHHAQDASHA
jgi:ABC-type bacteriocin/lantibiotic exporter with double-glycine peptidase domain